MRRVDDDVVDPRKVHPVGPHGDGGDQIRTNPRGGDQTRVLERSVRIRMRRVLVVARGLNNKSQSAAENS
jgi:hypothetical protein